MLWASTYMLFWIFYEFFSFRELIGMKIISFMFTIIFSCIFFIFCYCFVIYSNTNWWFWNRFDKINIIRKEFWLLDNLRPNDYKLIVRYNFWRKLILSLTIALQLKTNLSPFLLTFVIISSQSMYSNMITGLWQFKSLITRGLMIFNEIATIWVVLFASIEYLNESFSSNADLIKLQGFLLFLIRFHILSVVSVELSRILFSLSRILFLLSKNLISLIAVKLRRKLKIK